MYYDNFLQLELTFCSIRWAYRHMHGEWFPCVKLSGHGYPLSTTFNGCWLGWYGEHMWIVASAVRPKSESCWYALTKRYKGRIRSFAHLLTWMSSLRRSRQHLTHPVIRAERGKPVWLLDQRQVDSRWRQYNVKQVKDDKASEGYLVMR